jgi:hypothetical protein
MVTLSKKNKKGKSGSRFWRLLALGLLALVATTVWFQALGSDPITGLWDISPATTTTTTIVSSSHPDYWSKAASQLLASSSASSKVVYEHFTPDAFRKGRHDEYVNLPVFPRGVTRKAIDAAVQQAMKLPVDPPLGLLHQGTPSGNDVIMGLAAYPNNSLGIFRKLVGSLRNTGYDGHIILGVHKDISQQEQDYLKQMDVTQYVVEFAACDASLGPKDDGNYVVRGHCSKGLEKLKLEWGRFEMCRQWLKACKECTGWSLIMDTRDAFFQRHPFSGLHDAATSPYDLLFIEELSKHTVPDEFMNDPARYYTVDNSGFMKGHRGACYEGYHLEFLDRPVLCSGTVIGTREGMHRFLSVYVTEFYTNNARQNQRCKCPANTDQQQLQPMYYRGMFGEPERTRTVPWGMGPIMTIGHACINMHANITHSATDIRKLDINGSGLIVNNHEPPTSPSYIAPCVHQWDRCHSWIHPFFKEHPELFKEDKSGLV